MTEKEVGSVVTEKETVLNERPIEKRIEVVVDQETGKTVYHTFQVVEKTIEKEVQKQLINSL